MTNTDHDRPLDIAQRLANGKGGDLTAEQIGLDTEQARGFDKLHPMMGSPASHLP